MNEKRVNSNVSPRESHELAGNRAIVEQFLDDLQKELWNGGRYSVEYSADRKVKTIKLVLQLELL
jgi:hypothetical protein